MTKLASTWGTHAFLVLLTALPTAAATIHVPADAPTIQAGIVAAQPGDLVLVAPGVYTGVGNRAISYGGKAIEVRSEAGAPQTIVDLGGTFRGFSFVSGEDRDAILDGFTIRSGGTMFAGGIDCRSSSPSIRNCILELNEVLGDGGAVECRFGAAPMFEDCRFVRNTAGSGGAVASLAGSAPEFERCIFEDNEAPFGGAIEVDSGLPYFHDCLFNGNAATESGGAVLSFHSAAPVFDDTRLISNSANSGGALHASDGGALTLAGAILALNSANVGGALTLNGGTLQLDSSTLHGNQGAGASGVLLSAASSAIIENTIIHAGVGGAAMLCTGASSADLSCSDIFGQAGGDWIGCLAGQLGINGNIAGDPVFCGAASLDFTIDAASPCAPANSPGGCGLIGAEAVGCGATPVRPTTWGRLKTGFTE